MNNDKGTKLIMVKNDNEDNDHLRQNIFKKNVSELFYPDIDYNLLGDVCYVSKGMVTNAEDPPPSFTSQRFISYE